MKFEKLGNIATIKTGKYDVNHSTPDGEFVFYTCAYGQFKSPTYSFEGPAIILPGNGANVGEVFYYDGKFEAYQRTYVVQNFKADPNYIYAYFKAEWKKSLRNKQFGSATNYIRLNNLTDFSIPLPSLPDQLHIANILSKAENLIAQRKESIRLLDEFLKSTFLEMFLTKKKRENWHYTALKNTVEKHKHSIKAGPFGSSLKKEFYVPKGYKIYGQEQVIKDDLNYGDYYINEELYKKLESCKIKENDVLISLVGTYGKLSIVPKKFEAGIINPRIMKISFDKELINTIWFKHFFKSEFLHHQLRKYSHGNTMDIINVGIVKELIIPVPPLELQTQFAQIVEKTEALKSQYQQSLRELENLYGSLSQKAFRGELV